MKYALFNIRNEKINTEPRRVKKFVSTKVKELKEFEEAAVIHDIKSEDKIENSNDSINEV